MSKTYYENNNLNGLRKLENKKLSKTLFSAHASLLRKTWLSGKRLSATVWSSGAAMLSRKALLSYKVPCKASGPNMALTPLIPSDSRTLRRAGRLGLFASGLLLSQSVWAFSITSSSVSPSSVSRGQTVNISVSINSPTLQSNRIVDLEIYNSAGKVAQRFFSGQNFSSGGTLTYNWAYVVPTTLPLGTYSLRVGVFTSAWSGLYWNNNVRTFTVGSVTSPTPTPTPVPSTPPSDGTFKFMGAGAVLPSGEECARRVRRSSWEPRPNHYTQNHTIGKAGSYINSMSASFNSQYGGRIDGNFTGTTDEILQWAACKWGMDENVVRAKAAVESWWEQSLLGDYSTDSTACGKIGKAAPCYRSYGLLQVRADLQPHAYPYLQNSTAFAADFSMAWQRACIEGQTWVGTATRGDMWGCIGLYNSGRLNDATALNYINKVKDYMNRKVWLGQWF